MEDEVMFAVDTSEEASASRDAAEADTEKYLDLYRKKVFRLTLEGEHVE